MSMTPQLQKKIDRAIRLLQSIPLQEGEPVEVSYSGGKDSDVILQLVKEAGIEYRAIYKNTTIDPPGTVAHARAMGAEVIMPKESFFEIIARRGFPSRFVRFCCSELKEYKILDCAVQGIRRCESTKRAKRYQEPELCRTYKKGEKARIYLPILDWSDDDVAAFIADRGIKCHSLYYDENGNFLVERRLGCMGCPLASRKLRLQEFKRHPNLVKAWVRGGQKFLNSHPNTPSADKFKNGYELFVATVFYDSNFEFKGASAGLLGSIDCKEALENYFGITFNEATMPKI